MKTVFLRVIEADDKATALRAAIGEPGSARGWRRFEVNADSFAAIPRSPFAYWVTDQVRELFKSLPGLGADGRVIASGGKTLDDFRWIRGTWEAPRGKGSSWVPFAKGGSFSPFYSDVHLLLDWKNDARSLKEYLVSYRTARGWSPNWTAELHGSNYYLRPGLTWSRRADGLSLRAMPAGCVFSDKGPAAFVENDDTCTLLSLACITNSRAFFLLVSLQLARTELAQSYEVGVLQQTPIPRLTETEGALLARLARRAWSLKRSLDSRTETSHAFTRPALLQVCGADLAVRIEEWSKHVGDLEAELACIQAEIDERCYSLYGIEESDRRAVTEAFSGNDTDSEPSRYADQAEDDPGEDSEENERAPDALVRLAAELVCWAVGVAFGRFDVRLVTGARLLPTEPEPFDPLPACSPGMLTGDDGLPLVQRPTGYPFLFPENGLLTDDRGHSHDVTAAVRGVFDVVFGSDADRWWNDVAGLLNPKGHDFRSWLVGSFFEHHLKRYSRSRRKAPIFWQLSTPSVRYSVWLYAHRLTRDSFFQLQNDVIGPKLIHEERRLTTLVQNAGGSPTASERREIAAQEAFVEELRAMLDEVKRIAPFWNPNLDDGVVLTMAPLWRLVPQHRPWQKELKSKWDELVAGQYDWAYVAMHLWPERVVPKCAVDRSLAIAHGLEDVLWIEGATGKWSPRPTPVRSIDQLVRERGSPAVKAALESLCDGAVAPGSRVRGRSEAAR